MVKYLIRRNASNCSKIHYEGMWHKPGDNHNIVYAFTAAAVSTYFKDPVSQEQNWIYCGTTILIAELGTWPRTKKSQNL